MNAAILNEKYDGFAGPPSVLRGRPPRRPLAREARAFTSLRFAPSGEATPTTSTFVFPRSENPPGTRQYLVAKKHAESEIENRLRKYKTHMYYHLYQMFQAERAKADQQRGDSDESAAKASTASERRSEIQRVALTLIEIMEVSR